MLRFAIKIVNGIDWRQPWYSFLYIGVLFVGTFVSLFVVDWRTLNGHWQILVFFMGLSALAEILHVKLPLGKGRVSVSFAINLGAILLFDPQEAALVAAGGVLVANILQGLALDVILFNVGQIWVTAGSTALVWQTARSSNAVHPSLPGDLPALLSCVLVYFVVNNFLVLLSISVAYRLEFKELVTKNTIWLLPNHLALGSLGFLIAVLYLNIGVYGVLLLWIPLLLARYSFQQYIDIRAAHLETIHALASALDAKDPYTRGHSDRVSQYAVAIAKVMKLPDAELEMLRYAGVLHDIGKIGISDTVLNKVGRLTDEEFDLVKSHTTIGAHIIRPVGFLRGVSRVVRHHHERYDGRGYPDGVAGEEIPLGARIMAVADSFDAMTYDRVYRAGMDPDRAIDQLLQGRGSQFDPDVVDIFVNRVLPEQIDLTQDTSAKRRQDEDAVEGDRLWRHMVETSGEQAASSKREAAATREKPSKAGSGVD